MYKEVVIYSGRKVTVPDFVLEAMENFKPPVLHKDMRYNYENVTKRAKLN